MRAPELALFAVVSAGCGASHAVGGGPHVEVQPALPPAPLDPELTGVPGARAVWAPECEFGGSIYVVVVDPPGAATAPPLVLVHGLGQAGVRDFYPVLGALARGRRVVAFDLPGFGRSGRANEQYTPARYAAVLSHVIGQFAHGSADVLGHSMGGAIALMHAGTYPAEVRRLVLVDAAGILHREAWFGHHLRRVTDPATPWVPGVVDELQRAVAATFSATRALDLLPDVVLGTPLLRQQLLGGDPGQIAALGLILADFSGPIAAEAAPALIVWGGADQIAPQRTAELLSDRLPRAALTVLPGVGHNVMKEAPEPLVRAVLPFLAGGSPSAGPPLAGAAPGRDVTCAGQRDAHFSGAYGELVLDGCADATIEHASVRRLVLRGSSARVAHTDVAAGVRLERSRLLATGGRIGGDLPLELSDSDADLAGVALNGRDGTYRLDGTSHAIFSVCPLGGAAPARHLHGVVEANGPAVIGWAP